MKGWKEDLGTKVVVATSVGLGIYYAKDIRNFLGTPIYYLSGLTTGLIANIIDHASTIPAIKLMNTLEFRENGLDRLYRERNPIIGKHPTVRQYKIRSLIKGLFICALSTICPPIGYGYLAGVPLVVKDNKRNTKDLRRDLGSEVFR